MVTTPYHHLISQPQMHKLQNQLLQEESKNLRDSGGDHPQFRCYGGENWRSPHGWR